MNEKRPIDYAGRAIWDSMFYYAASYKPTPENARAMESYLTSQVQLIQNLCPKCSLNYKQKLDRFPLKYYLNSADDLIFLIYTFKDIVNKFQGKVSPPFLKVKQHYFSRVNKRCLECEGAQSQGAF